MEKKTYYTPEELEEHSEKKSEGPKFCTNCGAKIRGGKFCENCGSPL